MSAREHALSHPRCSFPDHLKRGFRVGGGHATPVGGAMHRRWVVGAAAIVGLAMSAPSAIADQSPPTCTSNSLDLTIERDHTLVRNGDVVTYTVTVANDALTACDVCG